MASIEDLERELANRQRAEYRRLQDAALVKEYTRREGHAPADQAAVLQRFPGQVVPALDPSRYLSEAEIDRARAADAAQKTK